MSPLITVVVTTTVITHQSEVPKSWINERRSPKCNHLKKMRERKREKNVRQGLFTC